MVALLEQLPYLVAGFVFGCGLYGVVTSRHLVHHVACLAVVQSSTYVILVGIGHRKGGQAPVFLDVPVSTPAVDPIVQALMLTDIVVEATVMALLLSLALQVHTRAGTMDPDEICRLRG